MTVKETLDFLLKCDNVNILTHKNPDGDTLGAGFALVNFLRSLGKKANVLNNEPFPSRYDFLYAGYEPMEFEEEFVVAVDIADLQLLGSNLDKYKEDGKIDLCIDHHRSNTFYAKETLLDENSAAACEIIFDIVEEYGKELSDIVAKCIYTGVATDTGCFKYENTTIRTHLIAAKLMKYNIDYANVNRAMFDLKSKARIKVETAVYENMEFYLDDECTIITITQDLVDKTGIDKAEFDGLSSIALQPEGVKLGILIKERYENAYKISVRTTQAVNACEFCQEFEGGGHNRAAGAQIYGTLDEVKELVLNAAKRALNKI